MVRAHEFAGRGGKILLQGDTAGFGQRDPKDVERLVHGGKGEGLAQRLCAGLHGAGILPAHIDAAGLAHVRGDERQGAGADERRAEHVQKMTKTHRHMLRLKSGLRQ